MLIAVLTYSAFFVLGLVCVGVQYVANRSHTEPNVGNNPTFLQFQKSYFLAYFPAIFADWLQGPYLYKLYSNYGFAEDQIAVLYVCGFASTVLLGTWAPVAADTFGRKKMCMVFTMIYSVSCVLKLFRNYGVLIIGRILGGIATSLLFSSFESWYMHEHIECNDFPKEWIPVTFSKASVWSSGLAIVAGVVATMFAEWLPLGPRAPFVVAIPILIASCVLIGQWQENYGKQQVQFSRNCMAGMKQILAQPRIFLIGIIQSLFESVMYIFIFVWTPTIMHDRPPLGIAFSSFMICIMIGSGLYRILSAKRFHDFTLLMAAMVAALGAILLCVVASHADGREVCYFAFLIFEVSVGLYFPSMGRIRSKVLPEANRTSIMNWFRVPLNLIACIVLMMLHNRRPHGNRMIFSTCAGLLAVATLCLFQFISLFKDDEEFKRSEQSEGEKEGEAPPQTA